MGSKPLSSEVILVIVVAISMLLISLATPCLTQSSPSYWLRTLGTSLSDEYGYGVAVDSNGSVYIVGSSGGTGFVTKLSSDGKILWSELVNISGYAVTLTGVAVGNGSVYVVGSGLGGSTRIAIVMKLNAADGRILWTRIFGGKYLPWSFTSVATVNGYVYAVGVGPSEFSYPEPDALVIKLSAANGSIVWADAIDVGGSNDYALGVTVSDNDIYIVGETALGGDYDAFVAKLDQNGDLLGLWVGGAKGLDSNEVLTAVSGGNGYLYTCGHLYNRSGYVYSSMIMSLSTSLTPAWVESIDSAVLNDLVINATQLYVVGELSGNIFLALLDTGNGTLVSSWIIDENDAAYGATLSNVTLVITGTTARWSVGGNDAFVASLVPRNNLVLSWVNTSWSNVTVESVSLSIRSASLPTQSVTPSVTKSSSLPSPSIQVQLTSWDPATYIAIYPYPPQQTSTTTVTTTTSAATTTTALTTQSTQQSLSVTTRATQGASTSTTRLPSPGVGGGGGGSSLGGTARSYLTPIVLAMFAMLTILTIVTLVQSLRTRRESA